MQGYQQHIASFLLLGFLFPQIAGSMHYSFVSHIPTVEKRPGYAKPDPGFQYHSCIYHLSGFSPLFAAENNAETSELLALQIAHNFYSLDNYVHQPNYNFQLRGPPFLQLFLQ